MSIKAKNILKEIHCGLNLLYKRRLKGVYLFGSYARGEEGPESDLDVLIVLDKIGHYSGEVDRTGEIISGLSLKYGIAISRVFVAEKDWRNTDTNFLANVREEAQTA